VARWRNVSKVGDVNTDEKLKRRFSNADAILQASIVPASFF
jgi:hypothetical protein